MNGDKLEKLLLSYETDVRFPDVSGMEHLDMLLNRTEIENNKSLLSAEQQERLVVADLQFVRQIDRFYAAIDQIADLGAWRAKVEPPSTHWWWYLDVLVYAWPRMQKAQVQPSFNVA
jgi:hypothetical protein